MGVFPGLILQWPPHIRVFMYIYIQYTYIYIGHHVVLLLLLQRVYFLGLVLQLPPHTLCVRYKFWKFSALPNSMYEIPVSWLLRICTRSERRGGFRNLLRDGQTVQTVPAAFRRAAHCQSQVAAWCRFEDSGILELGVECSVERVECSVWEYTYVHSRDSEQCVGCESIYTWFTVWNRHSRRRAQRV